VALTVAVHDRRHQEREMSIDPIAVLQLRHPIVLAPLGGGPSTPELVAAVSSAGGFGFLGAPYLTPDQIRDAAHRIRAITDRPFGLNLFAGAWSREVPAHPSALALVAEAHARLGLAPPQEPDVPVDPFPAQLEAVLEVRPAAFSFTFGIPPAAALRELAARGIATFGTATCVREARLLADAGVDGILAQGAEAGGHRGTFAASRDEGLVPTLELVAGIRREVPLPVVATGGIMDGADIRAALGAGAAAAQLGTAFLACPESGASAAYKRALLAAGADRTVLTRAFSGRWARGLANDFTRLTEAHPEAILPYPAQNQLTRAMRQAAARRGEPELLSLWAGQGVGRIRAMPAAELVRTIVDELRSLE
jgi:nitronate monooxygenase